MCKFDKFKKIFFALQFPVRKLGSREILGGFINIKFINILLINFHTPARSRAQTFDRKSSASVDLSPKLIVISQRIKGNILIYNNNIIKYAY